MTKHMTSLAKPTRHSHRVFSGRRWSVWILALVLLAPAAAADFVLVEQDSEVYYRYAVVAGDRLQIDKDVTVDGNAHSNDRADLAKDGHVTGDLSAVGTIQNQGEVDGDVIPGAPALDLPEIPDAGTLRAMADRVFEGDTTFNDDVVVDDVIFVAGSARFRGRLSGSGTVIASGDIRLDGDESASPSGQRLSLIALRDVRISKDLFQRAVIRAGRDVDFEQGVHFEGVVIGGRTVHLKKDVELTFVDFDQAAPVIELIEPADGSVLASSPVRIVAGWSDDLSGVDPATAVLLLDGADRTAEVVADGQGLTLALASPLAGGTHTVEISVADHSGKVGSGSFSFSVQSGPADTQAPAIGISQPLEPVVRAQPLTITVGYFDSGSGIALATLAIRLDGNDLTGTCAVGPREASCTVPVLAAGPHTVNADIRDIAGNLASARRDFTIVTDTGMQTVGLVAQADTYIGTAELEASHGSETGLRLGGSAEGRVLVRFDRNRVARAVGTGVLADARLELFVGGNEGGWGGAGGDVEIYRLLRPWVESDATWECPLGLDPGSPTGRCTPEWQGGEAAATATDAVRHDDATAGWVSFDVTADVLDLLAGTALDGWLLRKADESLGGGVVYTAREGGAEAPRLVLGFEAVAAPDLTPPELTFLAPPEGIIDADFNQHVTLSYLDLGSDVDLGGLEISFDGQDLTAECMVGDSVAYCELPGLTVGAHRVEASLSDVAGNRATARRDFEIRFDTAPPVLVVTTPTEGALVRTPQIEVAGMVSDDQGIALLEVEGVVVTPTAGAFSTLVNLHEGPNDLQVRAQDVSGRKVLVTRRVVLDTQPPLVRLVPMVPPIVVTGAADFTLAGDVRDFVGIESIDISGTPVSVDPGGSFSGTVPLAEGLNVLVLSVRDLAGNVTQATFEVTRFTTPEVAITSPLPGSLTTATTIEVQGTVSAGAAVTVDGIAAAVAGNTFTATGVPLHEGLNILTAIATDAAGHAATATVQVKRDRTPPQLIITAPAEGSRVVGATVTVTGLVSDVLGGLDPSATVTVNGVAAEVLGGTFAADAVPLAAGDNAVIAEAFDRAGNRGEARITVRRIDPAGGRIEVFSGNRQRGAVRSTLTEPLVARVVDASGNPVAGATVLFSLRGNDGSLEGSRRVAVTTGTDGLAQTLFTLGGRAGAGEQVVEAVASGYGGSALFVADADPGIPSQVFVDSGDQQTGCPGQPLPLPFVAVVTDTAFNRVPGVDVRFRVVLGDGVFENGLPQIDVTTDTMGVASATLVPGPTEGIANHVVRAEPATNPGSGYASFVASTQSPLDPALTSLSGLVLDNSDLPIPGATVTIDGAGLTTQTDDTGYFHFQPVPPGALHFHVDGNTSPRPGPWPALGFRIVAVPGRDNTLGRPIPLVRLTGNGVMVDETRGGTVTLPEIPGFALEVAPGSVTFPDGSRSGEVSVSVVHSDKVPMVPNFGQQPRFVITIQPSNAVFDPPARLTLPNLDGLAPGQVTEMYSFDHDAERFVAIGTGTVSDDGSVIVSDPGVGVVKAGWHCGGDPASSGTTHDCPVCQLCDGDKCVPEGKSLASPEVPRKQEQDCDDGNDCTRDFCEGGNCVHDPLDDTPCGDDGNPCTMDVCDNGTCTHPEIECMECQMCEDGTCVPDPADEGTQCMDEGDPSCSIDRCIGGNCMHTPLMGVDEYGPPDPPGLDTDGLTAGTQEALDCFRDAVTAAGGTFNLNSAFRPQAYQDHLRQVWFRHEDYLAAMAQGYAEDECNAVITSIETEWARHNIVAGPPRRVSNHSDGTAFDATVRVPAGGMTADQLAAGCGLNRPDPAGDPVHYVH